MGTFCVHNSHNPKSFFETPSRVHVNNAAEDRTQEEEKTTAATTAVAAGEDPAPALNIVDGAPKDEIIFTCQAHKGDC